MSKNLKMKVCVLLMHDVDFLLKLLLFAVVIIILIIL